MPRKSINCYYPAIVIDNNNNTQISNRDEDPTVELESLSEEACAQFTLADDSVAQSDSLPEIEESQENLAEAEAPISRGESSLMQELRNELKFRIEMNSILQLGIDQLREKCDRRSEQVSSLRKTNESLAAELEQSRQQAKKTKKQLAKSKESEKALLISIKELGKAGTDDGVIEGRGSVIEELREGNVEVTGTASDLEKQLESAMKNVDILETRMSEANAENTKLLAELESKNAQIDDYNREISALRRGSTPAEQTSTGRVSGTQPNRRSQSEACWVLVGLDEVDPYSYVVGDGVSTIGSSPDCDIEIPSKFVSRHHAQLVQTRKGCVLGDLNSTNGTYINSRRINRRILRAGDLITIGKERFRYERRSANGT